MPYTIHKTFEDREIASSRMIPKLEMSELRPYLLGSPLSTEQIVNFPKKMVLELHETNKYTAPDMLTNLGRIVVNKKVKSIIESFEGDCHLFLPLRTEDQHGNELGTYYFIVVTQEADGYVYEKTKFTQGYGLDAAKKTRFAVSKFDTNEEPNCVLRKAVVDGLHLWRGVTDGDRLNFFCSDQLGDALAEIGVTGCLFRQAVFD